MRIARYIDNGFSNNRGLAVSPGGIVFAGIADEGDAVSLWIISELTTPRMDSRAELGKFAYLDKRADPGTSHSSWMSIPSR